MHKFLIITAAALTLSACGVNPEQGRRVLESQGYTNVVIGGWTMFGCANSDDFKSSFTATGSNGQKVEGVLCSGWLKGITVRTY